MSQPPRTITTHAGAGSGRAAGARVPALFLVVECDRAQAGGARHLLAGVDRVELGRGAGRRAQRHLRDGVRVLRLDVPDGRMSSAHARLDQVMGAWVLTDTGSKNGVRVNGESVDRVELGDGDWIETGHTIFRLRLLAQPAAVGGVAAPLAEDLDAAELDADEGLRTLVPAVDAELARLRAVAPSTLPVIVQGESGSGKELVARALHALSGRGGELVAMNCGAIPDTMVEAELFGHKKGAFSGAVEDRPGRVRLAHRGTLLLDEIGDLPLASQAALLRTIQEGEVLGIGEARPQKVDVRFVAATHRDLPAMVAAGEFRADLYARLAGLVLQLPPLRQRMEDLGLLMAAILAKGPPARLGCEAVRRLCEHAWPLNVRELEQTLRRGVALAGGAPLTVEHLQLDGVPTRPGGAGPVEEDDERRARLLRLLATHGGNLAAVARELGTSRSQVHRWLKRYGLDRGGAR